MADFDGTGPPTLYRARPPDWLAAIHQDADLGYLGFHPPHPEQEEDSLTEKFVKEGFSATSVPAETFSALGFAKDEVSESRLISHLQDVVNRVFSRKQAHRPPVPPSNFKLPGRATVNEQRRSAWIKDLADPNIPLPKLGRSVPSGFKGHDLLEMLQSNNITISRAIWYIRVIGGNETQGMRNRPGFNPMQYSLEWCNNMTSYLKKLISEIALPSPPRAGISIKQTFKSSFLEQEPRENWVARCTYFLDLLHGCYCEGLVDQCAFLSWLSVQLSANLSTIPQLSLVCRLAEEYVEPLSRHRSYTQNFIYDCLDRFLEIERHPLVDHFKSTLATLRTLLQRMFSIYPDSFVCARLWKRYAVPMRQILGSLSSTRLETCDALQLKCNDFENIERRNEALVFRSLPHRESSCILALIEDVALLNSMSPYSSPSSINYFTEGCKFPGKLDLLLLWCITPHQHGDHRIYAAASLLANWRGLEDVKPQPCDREYDPRVHLQDMLFDWLETSAVPFMDLYIPAIARLFGELIRRDLFSYHKYLQRLIARCEVLDLGQEDRSFHSDLLKNIPITKLDAAAVQQRKIILYGHRARETEEDETDKVLQFEIVHTLPIFFPELRINDKALNVRNLRDSIAKLLISSTYKQSHALRSWVIPAVHRHLKKCFDPNTVDVEGYRIMLETVIKTECFSILLEILLDILRHGVTGPLLDTIINVLIRFADIWMAMECKQAIADAVCSAVSLWKHRDVDIRPVMKMMKELDLLHSISHSVSTEIVEYWTTLTETLRPPVPDAPPVPLTLPEVLLLAQDCQLNGPKLLAAALWSKYKSSPNLGWVLWDNAFASVRQIPALFSDSQSRHQCALKFADFLRAVHGFLPGDFDDQVHKWLGGPGQSELKALPAEIWELLVVVLEELMTRNVIRSATVFSGVLSLAWHIASSSTPVSLIDVAAMLKASNRLSWRILACTDEDDLRILAFEDFQHLASERGSVFSGLILQRLVDCIPRLVKIENDMRFEESLKQSLRTLRLRFTRCNEFRQSVATDLELFRMVFTSALARDGYDSSLRSEIATAGKVIVNEFYDTSGTSGCESDRITLQRSHWRFAKTAIEMQLTLHEYALEADDLSGDQRLHKFVDSFFECLSPLETDIIADAAKGLTSPLRSKLLVSGLKKIVLLLQSLDIKDRSSTDHFVHTAGEVLRILSRVTDPWDDAPLHCSESEIQAQEGFFTLLGSRLQSLLPSLSDELLDGDARGVVCDSALMIILVKLLQFILAFAHNWPPPFKLLVRALGRRMTQALFALGAGDTAEPKLFAILLDTTCYCLDESHIQDTIDEVELSASEIPPDLPNACRRRLFPLLRFVPQEHYTDDLAGVDAEQSTRASSMQARPWEWLDQAELHPEPLDKGFKHNPAISLDTFDIKMTRDHVIPPREDDQGVSTILATFQDALHLEPFFERDWRETRVATQLVSPKGSREQGIPIDKGSDNTFNVSSNTVRTSPAASTLSRSSGATSIGSWKHSPGQRPPSAGSAIEEESLSSIASATRSGKRKAQAADLTGIQPTASKRPRGGKTTRGRGKKK